MKMWDGRFSIAEDRLMEEFNNSLSFDRELIEDDIAGSIAWAHALHRAGVISARAAARIASGLNAIIKDHRAGKITFLSSDEDIHMAVERLLVERIGNAGERLHTGRSRNDQVATDLRLYTKRRMSAVVGFITALQNVLLERARGDLAVIMPGYTHLQQAQPVLLSHYWLSFLFLLERDKSRVLNAIQTADSMPLGSGAIAGTGFAVDRAALARELGFAAVSNNSMDGVASRDYVLEALASLASLGISLSRYAEDLIVWSSREFGYIELSDAWSTGSSMMPQKKNPDSLELIRGKSGRLIGNQTRLAATLKGVGLTYFKDLQEDKEPLFDSLRQAELVLTVFAKVIATLKVKADSMAKSLDPSLWATDLADYLVQKNVPFRQAHKVIGAIVRYCIDHSKALDTLSLDELKRFSPVFSSDVKKVFSWEQALAHRDIPGGTGRKSVAVQIKTAEKLLGKKN